MSSWNSQEGEEENDDLLRTDEEEEEETEGEINDRDLTGDEMDKLVQLQDLTGLDDLQICRALLESQNWDLEATARQHLNIPRMSRQESETGRSQQQPSPQSSIRDRGLRERGLQEQELREQGSSYNSHSEPSSSTYRVSNNNNNYNNNNSLWSWGLYLVTIPVRLPYRIAFSLINYVASFIGFNFTGVNRRPGNRISHQSDPNTDVQSFIDTLEAPYLPFSQGSYTQNLESAKRDLKFMLVYLHSPRHQNSKEFVDVSLKSEAFRDFLNRRANELIVWGCSVETAEGHRVSQIVKENGYPFMCLIVLRQNRMMIVGRIQGFTRGELLVESLEHIINDNEAFVVAARVDREERNITQNLRQEQDAAFQESLRLDQERERKKREEAERLQREAEEEEAAFRKQQERKQRIRQLKMNLVSQIPEEPSVHDPLTIKIVIKLPEGQRLERKFNKNISLKYLYFYVFCHPDSPDEFDITTNFPRKVLDCRPPYLDSFIENNIEITEEVEQESDPIPSFEEVGLGQSTMLFVNDLEA